MFDKQYRFTGSHAQKVNELTAIFDETSKAKLFERNLDVYINAPLIGYLYKRKGVKDTNGNINDQNVFPEQLINNSDQLKYIFRLILLLDTEHEPDKDKRLDKAFRTFEQSDNNDLALFDSYVLGGVDVLYEKLIQEATNSSDYINKLYDFLEEFQERFNEDISSETILKLCQGKPND